MISHVGTKTIRSLYWNAVVASRDRGQLARQRPSLFRRPAQRTSLPGTAFLYRKCTSAWCRIDSEERQNSHRGLGKKLCEKVCHTHACRLLQQVVCMLRTDDKKNSSWDAAQMCGNSESSHHLAYISISRESGVHLRSYLDCPHAEESGPCDHACNQKQHCW